MGRLKPTPPTRAERKAARVDQGEPVDQPKVFDLIQAWVHDRMPFHDACKAAGIRVNTARALLRDPKVRQRYRHEMDVLRESERVPSIHRLAHLRDHAKSERIQLEAARVLATDPESGSAGASVSVNVNFTPGYVIDLSGDAETARIGRVPATIDEQAVDISSD